MHVKRLPKGFSLIELMLTIAVMAAFVTVGIAAYQQKMQNAKIERAALQIQAWLQAGLAYRINNNDSKWPTTEELVEQDYIKSYSTPWQSCTKGTVSSCYEVSTDPISNNFIVSMDIAKVPNASSIANLLVNRLPNAYFDEEALTVNAAVPLPAMVGIHDGQVMIKDIRFISNAEKDNDDPYTLGPDTKMLPEDKIVCSSNQEPKRFYSLVNFDGAAKSRASFSYLWGAGVVEKDNKSIIYPQTNVVRFNHWSPDYKGKVMVIDACMPKKKNLTKTTNTATYNSYRY